MKRLHAITNKTTTAPLLLLLALMAPGLLPAAKFYSDDPLPAEPAPRDTSKAARRKISDYYDFFQQTFRPPGEKNKPGKPTPAMAVNTLGEPMDGPWYTRRHYYNPMSMEDLARGPGNANAPSQDGKWRVVKAKSEGVTPGFEFIDSRNRRFVLKFDPLEYPEIATGPDVLVSKFFWALGYWVPENYIVYFRRDQLELGKDVKLVDAKGQERPMTDRDITELLLRVPKGKDGRYRGGASLFLKGKPIGPYKYYGQRRDDPNDIVPHEHRRDLRGLSVFCAWMAHDDSRSINSLDMIVDVPGQAPHIRHHLIDFGSTLGSASYGPNSPRSGFEYVFEWPPLAKQFFTLGLWVPDWAKAKYPKDPAVGRFESKRFKAAQWIAEYPNPAFTNRLPDDAFWAAKQVMAFTSEQIRAIVKTAQYSRQETEDWIVNALIERRDKIGRDFFAPVLPLDKFEVSGGRLVFEDLEVRHNFRTAARQIGAAWSALDNSTGALKPLNHTGLSVPESAEPYIACELTDTASPKKRITVYLDQRRRVVGVERGW